MSCISLLNLVFFVSAVAGIGHFTNPQGADGAVSYTEGQQVQIEWTGVDNYDILSLGYYSSANQTITWLISNSDQKPTSFTWTVDAIEQGFDLSKSRMFRFYICKNYNFASPFYSAQFVVNENGQEPSITSSTMTATSSATTLSTQINNTSSSQTITTASGPTPNSSPSGSGLSESSTNQRPLASSESGLSTNAKIGVAIGTTATVALICGVILLFLRHLRSRKQVTQTQPIATASMGQYEVNPKGYPAGSAYTTTQAHAYTGKPTSEAKFLEMPGTNQPRQALSTELAATGNGQRAELG